MKIHLLRHGDANPARVTWSTDDEKPLSTRGHAEARRAGEALRVLGAEPDLVLTSPLTRARQTAEELCKALGAGQTPVVTQVLRPGATAGLLVEEIALHHPHATEAVCVGHMPDLGYIGAHLGAGPESGPFRLKTGSLVRIDVDGREARLAWFLSPQIIRRLTSRG